MSRNLSPRVYARAAANQPLESTGVATMNTFGPAFFTGIHAAGSAKVASTRCRGINKLDSEDALEPRSPCTDRAWETFLPALARQCSNPSLSTQTLRHRFCAGCPNIVSLRFAPPCRKIEYPIEKNLQAGRADEDPDVRYQLAENHQLAIEVLRLLCQDDNPYVSCRAARTVERIPKEIKDAVRRKAGHRSAARNPCGSGAHRQRRRLSDCNHM